LSYVTPTQWVHRPPWPNQTQALGVSDDPIRVRRTDGSALLLSLEQQHVVRRLDDDELAELGPWKVSRQAAIWAVVGVDRPGACASLAPRVAPQTPCLRGRDDRR
jgi:hypothetical protein